MTTWWELAIPAASAIGGAVVTGTIQGLTIRSQRRHERRLRFIDNKRAAYAQFLTSIEKTIQPIQALTTLENQLKELIQDLDSQREEFTALETALSTSGPSPELIDSFNEMTPASVTCRSNLVRYKQREVDLQRRPMRHLTCHPPCARCHRARKCTLVPSWGYENPSAPTTWADAGGFLMRLSRNITFPGR